MLQDQKPQYDDQEIRRLLGGRSFALYTLGCKVNQEEGEAIANLLTELGMRRQKISESNDVYIINTCTVTKTADSKSRQFIRRAINANPEAVVVAMGCYAQISTAEAAALDGVSLVLGTNDRDRLPELLASCLKQKAPQPIVQVSPALAATRYVEIGNRKPGGRRERAYIKIQDGCSQFCSYCIIPYARGPVKSRPAADILNEAAALIESGYPEIVLTGIHTGAYGVDLAEPIDLTALATRLVALPGMRRLHLGSIEPLEITDGLLELMRRYPNICRHLHIPVQAPCNRTLKAMNRHYTVEFYCDLIGKIRRLLPDCVITTDLIVGFPGETAAEFSAGLQILSELGLADVHVFPYSARPGTPAAAMPDQVNPTEKKRRAAAAAELKADLKAQCFAAQIGTEQEMLLEQRRSLNGQMYWLGHSKNYLPLALPDNGGYKRGLVLPVKVSSQLAEMLLVAALPEPAVG